MIAALTSGRLSSRTRLRLLAAAQSVPDKHADGDTARQWRLRFVRLRRWWHGRCLPGYLGMVGAAYVVSGPVLAVASCCYFWLLRRALRARRWRALRRISLSLCSEACMTIGDEIRAGQSPHLALVAATDMVCAGLRSCHPSCAQSDTACTLCAAVLRMLVAWQQVRNAASGDGVGVVAALRAVPVPQAAWCDRLAAVWKLQESGSALAGVLDGLDDELAAQRRCEQAAAIHTASARATVMVLSLLPALGIAVGCAMGADPAAVLLHSFLGACCALAAVGLHCAGWIWADWIVAADAGTPRMISAVRGVLSARTWRRDRCVSRQRLRGLASVLKVGSNDCDPFTVDSANTSTGITGPVARWFVGALAGVMAAWFIGSAVWAVPIGVGVTLGLVANMAWLRRRQDRRPDPGWLEQLPYALVLLSAALRSGSPTSQALCQVGAALSGRLGASLRAVGAAAALGEPIPAAWRRGICEAPDAAPLLRALARSGHSGAALAGSLVRMAAQLRESTQAAQEAAAQRRGVLMVAPLMCCFLPSFVLLGVVPVVVSVLQQALKTAI